MCDAQAGSRHPACARAETGRNAADRAVLVRSAAFVFLLTTYGGVQAQQSAGAAAASLPTPASARAALTAYAMEGDSIPLSLTGTAGDAARGRAIVASRQQGLCLLCHSGPFPEARFQGDLAPTLAGSGSRWSEGQLRLRLVDASSLNPATIMPSYYRTQDLVRTSAAWQGKPVLSAQQIEDVVSFLVTLKGDGDSGSNKKDGSE